MSKQLFDTIHNIARAKLRFNGLRILDTSTHKDVLIPFGVYRENIGKPILVPGALNLDTTYTIVTLDYNSLLQRGFGIVRSDVITRFTSGQRYNYTIQKLHLATGQIVNTLPDSLNIDYDRNSNAVRLVGKSAGVDGKGQWVVLNG